jgi:hypothetical protein
MEECGSEQRRMANNSEEGQGSQRAVMPVMMMMMMICNTNCFVHSSQKENKNQWHIKCLGG